MSTRANRSYRYSIRYRYPMISWRLLISTKPLSRFRQIHDVRKSWTKNEAERTKAKNSRMPSGHPVSLYLLHVPLGGTLVLPVATGLARGAEQQGSQFVYPLRGGDGAGRRRRGRRCGAQPVIPPQHRPQHPRVLPSAPPPLRLGSSPLSSVSPLRCFRYPFYRGTAALFSRSPLVYLPRAPLVTSFPLWGAISHRRTHATAWVVATPVAGELRSSADVASPRLDDDVDVHTRSPTRDTGAYHGTRPKQISDVRRLRLEFEISVGWRQRISRDIRGVTSSLFQNYTRAK